MFNIQILFNAGGDPLAIVQQTDRVDRVFLGTFVQIASPESFALFRFLEQRSRTRSESYRSQAFRVSQPFRSLRAAEICQAPTATRAAPATADMARKTFAHQPASREPNEKISYASHIPPNHAPVQRLKVIKKAAVSLLMPRLTTQSPGSCRDSPKNSEIEVD